MREAPDGSGEPSEQPFAVEAALTGGQQYTSARSCPLDRGILGVLVVFLSCLVFNEVLLVRGGVGGNGVRRGIIARSRFSSSSEGERQGEVTHASLDPHHDILALLVTDQDHFPLVEASRAWRQGIPAVVGVNFHPSIAQTAEAAQWNETLFFYPDDKILRTWYPGDTRAAILPLMAQALGKDYKWLLYGDDDTMFFLDNLVEMLRFFDPQLPYFISDNLWFNNGSAGVNNEHPELGAPRCVPCHWNPPHSANQPHLLHPNLGHGPEEEPWRHELWRFPPVPGCPCTPRLLCETEARRRNSGEGLLEQLALCSSAQPPFPGTLFSIHGGAGAVISKGLMDRLNAKEFEECVSTRTASGGDMLLTECLWLAGFAPTDPGGSFSYPSRQLFDPLQDVVVSDLLAAVDSKDMCTLDCQGRLTSMVSLHVRSRDNGIDEAKDAIKKISTLHHLLQSKPR